MYLTKGRVSPESFPSGHSEVFPGARHLELNVQTALGKKRPKEGWPKE
jgi:hypothetical protein